MLFWVGASVKWITKLWQDIGLFLYEYWAELFALCIVLIAVWIVGQLYGLPGDLDAEDFMVDNNEDRSLHR